MSDIEEFKKRLERQPDESVMDHAVRMFSDDPAVLKPGIEARKQHDAEHHKFWICSFCKQSVLVCLQDVTHTPLGNDQLHSWSPVQHPDGSIAHVLECIKRPK